ncbi:MAG: glycosyltransferase [Phormidesmis priestleyi]|uniref:Glycosyltransferase n=1 Tax=Phormidesmis priestleyi TaxID=268141 RepID=A0A2W4ZWG9_9CYAN|nr:MAG: glycosyltransferase [Phormidesmis priestleyi]
MAAPLISAIICTHNREQYLGAAIDSLLHQTFDSSAAGSSEDPGISNIYSDIHSDIHEDRYEIIVVDNASTDSTAAIVKARAHHPKLRYLYEPTLGLSVARNCGANAAQGQIIAYLDDDAEASAGWLAALLAVFDRHEQVAIAGGKVTLIWPPHTEPPNWLSQDLSSGLGAYDLGDELLYIQQPALTPRGLNYAIRKQFLESVGGFDPHLGRVGTNLLSNEEQQMTRLALDQGWQVVYVPQALAAHNVAPARLKPGWFMSRSWWQGISESYREQVSGTTGLWQLRSGGERLIRGLYKTLKYSHKPAQRFENLAYAYGQIGYLSSVIPHLIRHSTPPTTP